MRRRMKEPRTSLGRSGLVSADSCDSYPFYERPGYGHRPTRIAPRPSESVSARQCLASRSDVSVSADCAVTSNDLIPLFRRRYFTFHSRRAAGQSTLPQTTVTLYGSMTRTGTKLPSEVPSPKEPPSRGMKSPPRPQQ